MYQQPSKWLITLLLLPYLIFNVSSTFTQPSTLNQTIESMANQICSNLDDQMSCLVNLQSRLQYNHQNNATAVLTAAMEVSLNEAQLAIGLLSGFTSFSTGSASAREQIAVEDCKELLDFTVTELSWSMAEMRKLRVSRSSKHKKNMRAWLSAALSNQDTCLEGFQGTTRHVESFIKGSLRQVTQLVSNVLTLYTQTHPSLSRPPRRNYNSSSNSYDVGDLMNSRGVPEWMEDEDEVVRMADSPKGMWVHAVVALDGSGHYRSIGEAIAQAPSYSETKYVIHVKKGVYSENIDIKKKKTNIILLGDGIGATIITSSRNFMQGWTTFRTPTFAVSGRGFIAKDITFRNTAGPHNRQAVALRVDSDQSAFYRCSMEGYQDTLYAHSLRQFYRECHIYGTIDFLFGNGAAVFQNCNIYARVPLPLQKVTVAAQGRKTPHQSTGFTIQDSNVYSIRGNSMYLGRPWKEYSRVVYMNTYLGALVNPRGWLEWFGEFALGSCYFGEFENYGPGSGVSGRVKWPGFHVIKDVSQAEIFTAARFIDGMSWLPSTGVKFSAGLSH